MRQQIFQTKSKLLLIRSLNNFEVNEFIRLFEVPSIDSKTLVVVLKDSLCRMNITFERIRGQCYDGASTMRGVRGGAAKIIGGRTSSTIYSLLWTFHQSGH